ncbi:hypothetical protein ACH4SP_00640 [Streptomyces sp. NPDC021093]|uniref:hypothetical protein n=1 Tax=Streptomyces sp. NPDC021093 TaxID=3365112 RepID=UPI00379CEE48
MNTPPEPSANRQADIVEGDTAQAGATQADTVRADTVRADTVRADEAVEIDALLAEARHELGRRDAELRTARRELRRLRRARRAETYRRVVRNTQVPFRIGCAVLGTLAFLTGIVMLTQDHPQAADMLSAAGAFWALAVMLRAPR